jgi:prepilin-type N-terminal cleavage/methylation domain-containing protein
MGKALVVAGIPRQSRGLRVTLFAQGAGAEVRAAFTLIELVAAMAIVSILLLAIASALSFSIRATTGQGAVDQKNQLAVADVADQIADDMQVAMNFSERTSKSVAFTVPARVNGVPNQVRYAWDGTSGHSLYRQFMPAATPTLTASDATYTPVELLSGVTNFNLSYTLRTMGTAATTDSVLAFHDNTLLGSMATQSIDSTHWVSQYFPVVLPIGASSFSITRVQICAETGSTTPDGVMKVRLMTANGSNLPSTLIEEEPFYESALSSGFEYAEVQFSNVKNRTDSGLCLVIGYTAGSSPVAVVDYESALLQLLSGWTWATSSNGTSWSGAAANKCLRMYVYGTTQ